MKQGEANNMKEGWRKDGGVLLFVKLRSLARIKINLFGFIRYL